MDNLYEKVRRVFRLIFFSSIIVIFCTAILIVIVFLYFSRDLPELNKIVDYEPLAVSSVYSSNGKLIGQFYREKRFVVPFEKIPDGVIEAFISAEDASFFEHRGIDFMGIARAAIANIKAGRIVQGGSTITQQVAKSLLLSSERTFVRKIKEAILADRIEKNFTKDQILYLYLNQIYLGYRSYGIEAAAQNYFGKHVWELNLSESAVLAGLPKGPSKYNPFSNPRGAKRRQWYVLQRMYQNGFISKEEAINAKEALIKIKEQKKEFYEIAPYFVDMVRKYVIEKYGEEYVYKKQLKIHTSLNLRLQNIAQKAIRDGLRKVDKRQGYRGVLGHLEADEISDFRNKTHRKLLKSDLTLFNRLKNEALSEIDDLESMENILRKDDEERLVDKKLNEALLDSMDTPIKKGEEYEAVVLKVEDGEYKKGRPMPGSKKVYIAIGKRKGIIPLVYMEWAREPDPDVWWEYAKLKKPSQVLSAGDRILVEVAKIPPPGSVKDKNKIYTLELIAENDTVFERKVPYFIAKLSQEPLIQGALLSLSPETGMIDAMVGGYSFRTSQFNRAIQAIRQPGSTFKPFIYGAAIEKGFTPATMIIDSPIVYGDPENEHIWKPENYGEKSYGDTPLRNALIKSRNIPTIKLLKDIGIGYAINFARRLGITSQLTKDLSLALGSSGLTLMEMCRAYSTFPSGGKSIEPVYITKIEDRYGNILEYHAPRETLYDEEGNVFPGKEQLAEINDFVNEEAPRVISEQTAYIMTYLLREVVLYGTGRSVRALGRTCGGKTGTTNDFLDAWFMGFTRDVVTGVWVGFDDPDKPIGRFETGAKTASPIWLRYMRESVKRFPEKDFDVPEGIVFVNIDKETGKLADEPSNSVYEAFVEGTEPRASDKGPVGIAQGPEDVNKVLEEEEQFFKNGY